MKQEMDVDLSESKDAACQAASRHIEMYYNPWRRHSALQRDRDVPLELELEGLFKGHIRRGLLGGRSPR